MQNNTSKLENTTTSANLLVDYPLFDHHVGESRFVDGPLNDPITGLRPEQYRTYCIGNSIRKRRPLTQKMLS